MKRENIQGEKLTKLVWFDFKYNAGEKMTYSEMPAGISFKAICITFSQNISLLQEQWWRSVKLQGFFPPSCCITYLEAAQRAEPNYAKWENNYKWLRWVIVRAVFCLHSDSQVISHSIKMWRSETMAWMAN